MDVTPDLFKGGSDLDLFWGGLGPISMKVPRNVDVPTLKLGQMHSVLPLFPKSTEIIHKFGECVFCSLNLENCFGPQRIRNGFYGL